MKVIARKAIGVAHRRVAKPILFKIHPDRAHHAMTRTSRYVSLAKPITYVGRKAMAYKNDALLGQSLFGMRFMNPIGISAGLDKNADMPHIAQMIGCGFTTCGSMTIEPRHGNEHPWFYRLPKSRALVVHVGMANEGMRNIAPRLRRRPAGMPTVVSVAVVARDTTCHEPEIIADVQEGIRYLVANDLAECIELNISCPNVHGDQIFTRPDTLERLLNAVDDLRVEKPIFIKMPNLSDWDKFVALLDVILNHTVQAVVIANLIKDRSTIQLKEELPKTVKGGVSGDPIKAQTVALIRNTYEYCGDRLKIIGVGGTFNADDVYEKILAGASLVGLITGIIFEGPQMIAESNHKLAELLQRDGYENASEAVGAATERGVSRP